MLLIMRLKQKRLDLTQCTDCTCMNLRKAARAVTQLYEKVMQPTGLRGTQYTLLVGLAMAGPVTMTRLAEWFVMDRTTLTRNLRLLARQSLIKVTPGEDRRERVVTLTDRGHDAVTKALPLWQKAQQRVVQGLGQKRWRRLLNDLSAVANMAQGS